MSKKASEQDVLDLLRDLKNSEGNYPSELIHSRRETFVKQAAAMAVLVRAGLHEATKTAAGQAETASGGASTATGASVGTSLGTILETVLVAAIVVEVGVVGYVYRDKIADFINSKINPTIEVVASPPGDSSPNILTEDINATETPIATETMTDTETPVPSVTLLPVVDDPSNNGTSGATQVVSTPEPTKPGLHLGQTKQPTKEPDQNNSNTKEKNKDN